MAVKHYIVTGGNRGLGFHIAKNLSLLPDAHITLAVRDRESGWKAAEKIGTNVSVRQIDLCSVQSIGEFTNNWKSPITALINNAGVQILDSSRFTEEGFEETFAVNYLNPLLLTLRLMPFFESSRVLFIGSGTHNPNHPVASRFGFRGARFESIQKCAEGLGPDTNTDRLGKDRYATAKFLVMAATVGLSRRISPNTASFYCLDPGLMPGTELLRTAPAHLQFGWKTILPFFSGLIPDSSTPVKSGEAGAWLMKAESSRLANGGIYSYDRRLSRGVWKHVYEEETEAQILKDSLELLGLDPSALKTEPPTDNL